MNVTLSISTNSIKILSARGRQVKQWGSAPLEPGLVRDGLILQPKALAAAINTLFATTKVSKERVIVSLSCVSFTYRILNLPRMKSARLEEAILRGAKREIPLPLEELYLSWQAIDNKQNELDFFIIGVPRNIIDTAVQTLAEAGVKPYIMDLKPMALARAANRSDVIIVALDPDCFDIVLVANGIPDCLHTVTPRGEGASLEDNIQRLTGELSKTVKFYDSMHQENPLNRNTPLLLTGELSANPATGKLIQTETEFPVGPLVPPLQFPPDFPIDLYSTNAGLALKQVTQKTLTRKTTTLFHDINVNILSGKYRERAHPLGLKNTLLILTLILVIGLSFPLYYFKGQAEIETTRLQAELAGAGQELREVRLALNETKQVEDIISETTTEADSLRQEHQIILGKGGNFTGNMKSVTDALPPGTYFTSMEIGTDLITVNGEADSSFSVIRYAVALEANGDFSEVRITEINGSKSTEEESHTVSFIIAITM